MKNNNSIRINLSAIPDIIPIISHHLLLYDEKFRFNKIFRKQNDDQLLKFFFGDNQKVIKYINNYIGREYDIECKEIDLTPLMECINNTYNLNVKKIRLLYNSKHTKWIHNINDNFKCYDENNKRINIYYNDDDWIKLDDKEDIENYYIGMNNRKTILNKEQRAKSKK